jgi:hypothetical protein
MKPGPAPKLGPAPEPDERIQFRQIEKKATELLEKAKAEGRRIKFVAVISEDADRVTRFDWTQMDDLWEVLGVIEMLKHDIMAGSQGGE